MSPPAVSTYAVRCVPAGFFGAGRRDARGFLLGMMVTSFALRQDLDPYCAQHKT